MKKIAPAREEILLCAEPGYRDIFARYARFFAPGNLIFLRGPMGAGKTTFVRAVCDLLATEDLASSPSFALLNVYHTAAFRIAHFDLFRLSAAHQLDDIGGLDFLGEGVLTLVEWPENCAGFFPPPDLDITFAFADEALSARRITILEGA